MQVPPGEPVVALILHRNLRSREVNSHPQDHNASKYRGQLHKEKDELSKEVILCREGLSPRGQGRLQAVCGELQKPGVKAPDHVSSSARTEGLKVEGL